MEIPASIPGTLLIVRIPVVCTRFNPARIAKVLRVTGNVSRVMHRHAVILHEPR
jgi:hypothetical protein